MNNIFYKKQSSDWFFYYIILCIYGFLLNFASPIVLNLSTEYSFDSVYSSYYYWTVFLGIVAFIFVPAQIRKRNLEDNPYFRSSTFMTTLVFPPFKPNFLICWISLKFLIFIFILSIGLFITSFIEIIFLMLIFFCTLVSST